MCGALTHFEWKCRNSRSRLLMGRTRSGRSACRGERRHGLFARKARAAHASNAARRTILWHTATGFAYMPSLVVPCAPNDVKRSSAAHRLCSRSGTALRSAFKRDSPSITSSALVAPTPLSGVGIFDSHILMTTENLPRGVRAAARFGPV
jgi:hypothetical protein